MADWRRALERRGAQQVRTYVTSGNAVLTVAGDHDWVTALVVASARDCGVQAEAVVRSARQLAEVVAGNPWPQRTAWPTQLHVGFLSAPGGGAVRRLAQHEQVRFDGAHVWIWYGAGAGQSRLTVDVGDRVLTTRNWRTVTMLADLAAG